VGHLGEVVENFFGCMHQNLTSDVKLSPDLIGPVRSILACRAETRTPSDRSLHTVPYSECLPRPFSENMGMSRQGQS
jgi:hypothetical protein